MRITILQGPFLPVPPIRGGAIEKAWFRLGMEFRRMGHEVAHLSRECDGLQKKETIEGVRHFRVPGNESTTFLPMLKFRDLQYVLRAKRVLLPTDILVTHSFWAPILLDSKACGRKYVHVGRFPKGQMKLYQNVSRLQAPSASVARAICREVPDSSQLVKAIPYPLPWDCPSLNLGEGREKTILYHGRIHPEKGLRELVMAFTSLPENLLKEWRLVVRGPWRIEQGGAGRAFLEELRNLAISASERITFFDPAFDDETLRQDLGRAGLFVYPSLAERGETFGLAALEAMSCGCPPLVSGLSCFKDFVSDGENGFVFNHLDTDVAVALRDKLAKVLHNPECLSDAGLKASRDAADYALKPVARLFLEDFESIFTNAAL